MVSGLQAPVSRGAARCTAVLDFSKPHFPRSEAEYEAAVAEIERLLDEALERGAEGWGRLEFLSVLVEHYEEERYPAGTVTPQEAVLLRSIPYPLAGIARRLIESYAEARSECLQI